MAFLKQFGLDKNLKPQKAIKQLYPASIERDYEKELLRIVNFIYRDIRSKFILPEIKQGIVNLRQIRKDDLSEDVARLIASSKVNFSNNFTEDFLERTTEEFAMATSDFNRAQVRKVIASIVGVDIFINEPWLLDELNIFAKNNISLIKSIPNRFFDEIENMTFRTFREGLRHEALMKELRRKYLKDRNRARLIARDQIGKLNGQLTKLRQTNIGIKKYTWRNVGDRRVRGNPFGLYPRAEYSHWDREGKIFSWKKPPADGHPGEPIQCRCWAEPIIK